MNSFCVSFFFSNIVIQYAATINSNICKTWSSKVVVITADKTFMMLYLRGWLWPLIVSLYLFVRFVADFA